MKWFEKKWFVDLKTKTRQRLCFLFVALIAAGIGLAAIMFLFFAKVPNAPTYAIILGAACVLNIRISLDSGDFGKY